VSTHFSGGIWLVGIARNIQLLIDLVRKQNLEPRLMECEMLWLKILLKELGYDSKDSMRLYCDNKDVINVAHNPAQHD
jgi:hypothetical protein